jgi:D-alanyl-D-alanine carboxypeptidase
MNYSRLGILILILLLCILIIPRKIGNPNESIPVELPSLSSATSTQITEIDEEYSSTTILQSIDSSTTTLSIDAPLIKLWQGIGGIRSTQKVGKQNKEVILVQGALKAFVPEFRNLNITGIYGSKTVESVKSLQKKWGLPVTGIVDSKTRELINQKYLDDLCPQVNGVDRSYEHVDRDTALPLDYVPPNLVELKSPIRTAGVVCLSSEPARRLSDLFIAAKKDGISLIVFSGYRRPEIQILLKNWWKSQGVVNNENAYGLAEAGHSEHQLGTTVDMSGKSINYIGPSDKFGTSKEGIWLKKNSYKYGFIMSYPKGKESETGYQYEPWHFRYIGVDNARDIYEDNLTIKKYFEMVSSPAKPIDDSL